MWVAIIFGVVLVLAHGVAHLTVREFVQLWGENLFIAAGPRRREAGSTWAMGGGLIVACISFGTVGGAKASDSTLVLGWIVFTYGSFVAWRVGEAIELATMTRDIGEKVAKEQVRQGIYNPPPPPPPPINPEKEARRAVEVTKNLYRLNGREAPPEELRNTYEYYKARYQREREQASAPAQARVVDAQVSFNPSVARQHDGGVFDFDPARFKHREPQASPALPRMIERQHDYEHQEWQNERARPSQQAAARQPAPPAQAMPSFTYDGSKVWK